MLLVYILCALHVAQYTELLSVCLLNGKTLRRQRAIQPTTDFSIRNSVSFQRSEVGGKRVCKDRAPQPGGRFVPSVRAARSVIHVESGMKRLVWRLPFSLLAAGPFPFSLENISVGACLSKSEQI